MNYFEDQGSADTPGRESPIRRLMRSRAFVITASAVIAVVIIAIAAAPYVIRSSLVRALERSGMTGVSVSDVDFNPVTRTLAVKRFAFASPDGVSVAGRLVEVRFRVLPVVKHRVSLREIKLDGIVVAVDSDAKKQKPEGAVDKAARAESRGSGGRWKAGLDTFSITDSSVSYITGGEEATVTIGEMTLAGYKGWDPAHPVEMQLRAGLDTGVVRIKATGTPLAAEPGMRATLEIDELPLEWAAPLVKDAMAALAGKVSAEITVDAQTKPGAGTMDIMHGGTIALEGFTAEVAERRMTVGRAAVEVTLDALHPLPAGEGRPVMRSLEGMASIGGRAPGVDKGEGISVVSIPDNIELLGAGSVVVTGVKVDAERRAKVDSVKVAGVRAGALMGDTTGKAPLVSASLITGAGFEVVPGELVSIGSIEIDQPKVGIERDSSGRVPLLEMTLAAASADKGADETKTAPQPEPAGAAPAEKPAPRIVIGRIEMTGGGAASFSDRSVKPEFTAKLDLGRLKLTGIDTSPPDPKSPGAGIEMSAGIGEYSKIDLNGTIALHDSPPSLNLKGRVTSLDMPPLSSYTSTALGYNLVSGHMDGDLSAVVDKGEIDGSADLLLRGLDVAPSGDDSAEELKTELTMPLGSALSLLRSSDGNIKLKIPVTGDLKSPKFSLASVINKAVAGAMKKAAFSYLKYYFQPYGTLITAVQVAGKYASAVRLDPVVFEPGSVEITPAAAEYIAKVAGFMSERPGVTVKVCGHAVDDEPLDDWKRVRREAQKASGAELSAAHDGLALMRAERIKSHLVTKYGIEDARMLVCLPVVDKAPVVEVAAPPAADAKATAKESDAEAAAAPAPPEKPLPRVEILI